MATILEVGRLETQMKKASIRNVTAHRMGGKLVLILAIHGFRMKDIVDSYGSNYKEMTKLSSMAKESPKCEMNKITAETPRLTIDKTSFQNENTEGQPNPAIAKESHSPRCMGSINCHFEISNNDSMK
ncbi:hypothetical protein Ancab_002080 [Ancistrocladus abbreviatus]